MAWRRPVCLGLYLFALGSSNILTMGSMHARTVVMGAARLAFLTCNYGSNKILMGPEVAAEHSGAGPLPPACSQNGHLSPSRLCEAKRGWQRLHRDTPHRTW